MEGAHEFYNPSKESVSNTTHMLVFGGTGTVGKAFSAEADRAGCVVTSLSRSNGIDLANPDLDIAAILEPRLSARTVILNFAAETANERAKRGNEDSLWLNALAPEHLAKTSKELGVPFLHLSTNAVYQDLPEGKESYTEEDIPDIGKPNSFPTWYGYTKALGENYALAHDAVVARLGNVQGQRGLYQATCEAIRNGEHFTRVADHQIAPLPDFVVAQSLLAISNQMAEQELIREIYNVSAKDVSTPYDIAFMVAEAYGLPSPEIEGITLDERLALNPNEAVAARHNQMDVSKFEMSFQPLPTVAEGVRMFAARYP